MTAEEIIRRNLHYMRKHPYLIIRCGQDLIEADKREQNIFGFPIKPVDKNLSK